VISGISKKIEEIDNIMKEFGQNSTAYPAYRKKVDKLL